MDNFALISSQFPSLGVAAPPSTGFLSRRPIYHLLPPPPMHSSRFGGRTAGVVALFGFGRRGSSGGSQRVEKAGKETLEVNDIARISSPNSSQMMTTSTSMPPLPVPPSSSYIGSPLLWIGVGVGLSVIFQVVAARLKTYALQQAFKTMMDQAAPQGAQFNNPMFSPGLQFPFPPPSSPSSTPTFTQATQTSSQPVVEVDAAVTEVEATPFYEVKDEPEVKETQKKYAFVDVSSEELLESERSFSRESTKESVPQSQPEKDVSSNGTVKQEERPPSGQSQSGRSAPPISVEALEKMMEDPTVQKMVYPYLPEEMRNPTSFKWMMQNPQFRQQMQEMLNNMGGTAEWDNRMTDTLKNFDLSSPEVKQQFEQIGLTPEEVISKIMANPDVAMAFQNPKVQAAILDCSQNPLSIAKYQNDKEVMDVFTKISELFPGVTGYP